MSTTDPHTASSAPLEPTISRTVALAAGVAIIPPNPPNAPLVTTISNTPIEASTSLTRQLSRSLSLSQPGASALKAPNDRSPSPSPSASSAHPPQPIHQPLKGARLIVVATIVTFTMMLGAGSAQGLNIALPTIGKELNMKNSDLQWIASAYTLTNGCFLLLSGRMADVHGRKLLFVCGLTWWSIWCLVGGFMNNGPALVVARALAGSGAAMSTPSAIGIIATHFSGKARSTAFAAFAAGAPIGAAFGLIIGGLPTAYSKYTWRPCLWILAGLGFAVVITAYFVVPTDPFHTSDRRVDWFGAALITVGLIFIQFAISAGETAPQGWATSYIIALLIIGIALVVIFFFWEYHVVYRTTRPPLMRLQLWTRAKGRLASVYFIGFVSWMGFTALFYHSTLFYQDIQHTGPVGALLRFIPCSVSGVLCNVVVAFLVAKVPTQALIVTGVLSTGVLMAIAPADVSYWRLPFNAMWMAVLGADFLMATGSIFVAALALPDEQSVAGALFQTLVQLGGAFGLAITTVISDAYDKKSLAAGVDALNSQLNGIHAAFWLGSGTSFLACAVAVVMLRGMGAIGKQPKKAVEPVAHEREGDEEEKSVIGAASRPDDKV